MQGSTCQTRHGLNLHHWSKLNNVSYLPSLVPILQAGLVVKQYRRVPLADLEMVLPGAAVHLPPNLYLSLAFTLAAGLAAAAVALWQVGCHALRVGGLLWVAAERAAGCIHFGLEVMPAPIMPLALASPSHRPLGAFLATPALGLPCHTIPACLATPAVTLWSAGRLERGAAEDPGHHTFHQVCAYAWVDGCMGAWVSTKWVGGPASAGGTWVLEMVLGGWWPKHGVELRVCLAFCAADH